MKNIFEHVKDQGLEFAHVYKGFRSKTHDNGQTEPIYRWGVHLFSPTARREITDPLLPKASWTYRATWSEAMEILEPNGASGARYLGHDLLMFEAMWSALLVYERYLKAGDDFTAFLLTRGVRTAAFPTDNREPSAKERTMSAREHHWRGEWAREKRLARDLESVVGRDVLAYWLAHTEH